MKRLTIEQMTIQNFKGVTDLTVEFSPSVTRISGRNEAGKTTIPDAFCWVLFNKDSNGKTPGTDDFHEKPLDDAGNEIHNLDTMVELRCKVNDLPFNLCRLQRENWVKKRGNTDAEFQGNTSQYWINGVEVKLSDFKSRIAEIAPEDVFRVIGMLSAFNALDWKKRREQLLAMTGDVTESILNRDEYAPITMECAKRGIDVDDLRKVMTDQRRSINKELDMLPVRIDEARKALHDVSPADLAEAQKEIADAETEIKRINDAILDARANSANEKAEREIVDLEAEAVSLNRQRAVVHYRQKELLQSQMTDARESLRRAQAESEDAERLYAMREKTLETSKTTKEALKKAYTGVYESAYSDDIVADTCPTCGQQLPADGVEAARKSAKIAFDTRRNQKLLEIQAQGKDCANQIKELEGMLSALETDRANASEAVNARQAAFDNAADAWKTYPAAPDYDKEPRLAEIAERIAGLRSAQKDTPEDAVKDLQFQKTVVETKITDSKGIIALHEAAKATTARIQQLTADQKAAASSLAETEKLLTLIERYVQAYCSMLEESINELFPTLRWKLFDTQINGGITDTCICMVPCQSGLIPYGTANTGSKINADLEIINVLSKFYEVSLPVFADNCERVNKLIQTDAQMILLAVTLDPELKIERE
ncbi:MAG: AAA family ATPase [Dehalococcoidia bacterium]|jgi:DNA repair exonuclease SbcCD ATPase subunit